MGTIKIIIYSTSNGAEPYSTWEDRLDNKTMVKVKNRLNRVRLGNFGDSKRIKGGEGIWELCIDYGPGYRIYFGKEDTTIVILLTAGDKGSQERDIAKAKRYWDDYKGQR